MGDSSTKKVGGTGRYVGPDTSNPFYQQLQSGGTYDPTRFMGAGAGLYGQGISALQGGVSDADYARAREQARQTAEGAYTMYGQSARDLAQRQSRAAQEQIASELAGSGALNSGAALASIAEGTANPLLQAETNLAQLYGNAYTGTAGQLYGQAGQNLSNIASLYGQQGAQQYGLGGQALGLLGQYGQSQYIAPQYYQQPGIGDTLLGAGLGIASGFAGGLAGGLGGSLGSRLF